MQAAKRWVVKRFRPWFGSLTYVARRGLIKGMRRKGGLSFVPSTKLSAEEKFLLSLNLAGLTVYDVGGWEGVYTMFFARAVGASGRVVTFEPNPQNRKRIAENVTLNGLSNVTLRPVALGKAAGPATLVVEMGVSGEGHVRSIAHAVPETAEGESVVRIDVETLDREIRAQALRAPQFVKIDVEGFELDVLQGMSEIIASQRPRIFVEVHRLDERPGNAREVIDFLLQHRYSVKHLEGAAAIDDSHTMLAHSDHLYCE